MTTPTPAIRSEPTMLKQRITLALAVSLLLHGLLLSVHFRLPERAPVRDSGLEVVLVNTRHARAPDKPEALAQANVDGGGTSETGNAQPKSPLPLQKTPSEGAALVEARRKQVQREATPQQVMTRDKSTAHIPSPSDPSLSTVAPTAPAVSGVDLFDSVVATSEVAARIERSLDEIANRPRTQFIGARAKEYRFAQYVEDWRHKIERVGTLNYPEAARGKLYGSLLLSVTIRADGSVARVSVHRSSGYPLLDEAAVRIVQLGAPYAAFTPDIRKDTDFIEITRTWTFTNGDQVRAN